MAPRPIAKAPAVSAARADFTGARKICRRTNRHATAARLPRDRSGGMASRTARTASRERPAASGGGVSGRAWRLLFLSRTCAPPWSCSSTGLSARMRAAVRTMAVRSRSAPAARGASHRGLSRAWGMPSTANSSSASRVSEALRRVLIHPKAPPRGTASAPISAMGRALSRTHRLMGRPIARTMASSFPRERK